MHNDVARQEVPLPRPMPRKLDAPPQFAPPNQWPAWVWVVIATVIISPLVLIVGFFVVAVATAKPTPVVPPPVLPPPVVKLPSDGEVYLQTNEFIRELLVAPKTAEFAKTGEVTKLVNAKGHVWRVKSHFDSQNRYGAFLRGTYTAEISFTPADQIWRLEIAYIDDELKYASKETKKSLRKLQAAFAFDNRTTPLLGTWTHDAAATRQANERADEADLLSQIATWQKHRIEFHRDGFYVSHLREPAGEPWMIWSLNRKVGNAFVLDLDIEQDKPVPLRVELISGELIGIEWADGIVSVYRKQLAEADSGRASD